MKLTILVKMNRKEIKAFKQLFKLHRNLFCQSHFGFCSYSKNMISNAKKSFEHQLTSMIDFSQDLYELPITQEFKNSLVLKNQKNLNRNKNFSCFSDFFDKSENYCFNSPNTGNLPYDKSVERQINAICSFYSNFTPNILASIETIQQKGDFKTIINKDNFLQWKIFTFELDYNFKINNVNLFFEEIKKMFKAHSKLQHAKTFFILEDFYSRGCFYKWFDNFTGKPFENNPSVYVDYYDEKHR